MTRDDCTFFRTAAAFRRWLARNHDRAAELWVGFYKKDSGKGGLTYREALDEALCFGWIDGVRKSVDAESYAQRFTPRTRRSNWSAVNIRRVDELTRDGRMQPPGVAAFESRDTRRVDQYSYEQRKAVELEPAMVRKFRGNRQAWAFFEAQAPWYRRVTTWWVVSAKKPETRERRLAQLIADSAAHRRIPQIPASKSKT